LKYFKGIAYYSLFLWSFCHQYLMAYADADHAGDLDDHKSRSGCVVFLNGGPITWVSCKQQCIASLNTKAEYVVAAMATKEIIWLCHLLADLQYSQSAPIAVFFRYLECHLACFQS
jgi:hypothetical protein